MTSIRGVEWISITAATLCTIPLVMATAVNLRPGEPVSVLVRLCCSILFIILLITNVVLVMFDVEATSFIITNGVISLLGSAVVFGIYTSKA